MEPADKIAELLSGEGIEFVREFRFDRTSPGEMIDIGIETHKVGEKMKRNTCLRSIKTPRLFRFDFAIPKYKIAIEYEGGTWSGGAHTRGDIYLRDCQKYNLAVLQGWKILRYTSSYLKAGTTQLMINQIKNLISIMDGSARENRLELFSPEDQS